MRIISGKYKGKNIMGFNINGTRPTMDRVKESVFASIQNKIKNSSCLDLFAGSGSLGLEAISNGAENCYFVDINKEAINILKRNIDNINVNDKCYILNDNYINALKYFNQNNINFDLIFLDPPYNLNLITNALKLINDYSLLKKDGLIICEYETEIIDTTFNLIKIKKYGSKQVAIYSY